MNMTCGVCHKPTTRATSTVVPRMRRISDGKRAGQLEPTGDTTRYCATCLEAAKR